MVPFAEGNALSLSVCEAESAGDGTVATVAGTYASEGDFLGTPGYFLVDSGNNCEVNLEVPASAVAACRDGMQASATGTLEYVIEMPMVEEYMMLTTREVVCRE